jgi:hypothetical protein
MFSLALYMTHHSQAKAKAEEEEAARRKEEEAR